MQALAAFPGRLVVIAVIFFAENVNASQEIGGEFRLKLSQVLSVPVAVEEKRPANQSERIRVAGFRLRGNTVFPDRELLDLIADGVGKTLTLEQIEHRVARIGSYYHSRGYVLARAYVPGQTIQDAVVEVVVAEGRLGNVMVDTGKVRGIDAQRIDSIVAPLRDGSRVAHMPSIERALLILSSLPGVTARGTLQRGTQADTADLLIELESGDRLEVSSAIDNFGTPYTGRQRLSVEVRMNGLAGNGDQASIQATQSSADLMSVHAHYEMPLGSDGMRLSLSYATLDYRLGEEFSAAGAAGHSAVAGVSVQSPLVLSRRQNVTLIAGAERKVLSEQVDAAQSRAEKTIYSANVGLRGNRQDEWLGGGASSYAAMLAFGQLSGELAEPSAAALRRRFTKLNWEAGRSQQLMPGLLLSGLMRGQLSSTNLDPSEKFFLGGPTGLRAFESGEGTGDQGIMANLDLRYNLGTAMSITGFIDAGRVQINKEQFLAGPNRWSASDAGVGLGWNFGTAASLSAVYATQINANMPGSDDERRHRLWLLLSMTPDLWKGFASSADSAGPTAFETQTEVADAGSGIKIGGSLDSLFILSGARGATAAGLTGASQASSPTGASDFSQQTFNNKAAVSFRGEEYLGSGMRAWFQIESGTSGTGQITISAGNTGVALESRPHGTLLFSQQWDTPYKFEAARLDPFDAEHFSSLFSLLGTPGFAINSANQAGPVSTPDVRNSDDAAFTRRQGNSVQYWSPSFAGWSSRLVYSGGADPLHVLAGKPLLWGGSVRRQSGPLEFFGAYERHVNYYGITSLGMNTRGVGSPIGPLSNSTSRDDGLEFGIAYQFGSTKVSAMWERLRYREDGVVPGNAPDLQSYQRDAVWTGIKQQIGRFVLKATYGVASAGRCTALLRGDPAPPCTTQGLGASMYSLGATYLFSNRTSVYAEHARIRNNPFSRYNFTSSGISGLSVGADPYAFGFGIAHNF